MQRRGGYYNQAHGPHAEAFQDRRRGALDAGGAGLGLLEMLHNGTLTGKVCSSSTLEDGATCDRGAVTLSAKIGGSTI